MKQSFALSIALLFSVMSAVAQVQLPNLSNKAGNFLKQGAPSQGETVFGLKETLNVGISTARVKLSASDGFLNHENLKILFPPETIKLEKTLRAAGMGALCDDFIISVNTAASQAVSQAEPIFVNALREMSFRDATSILLAKESNAATKYFEKATSRELLEIFRPIIEQQISHTGATKYWVEILSKYNQLPLTTKIETDLAAYVSAKAVSGLFLEIANQELMIRRNSTSRTSPTMRKIWNYADQQLYN